MTTQKTFKRRVRARMTKTGESYTAARRTLIRPAAEPTAAAPAFTPPVSDEAMTRTTGHGYAYWFRLLDRWDATKRTHTDTTRWLMSEHGVPGWWTQAIAVGYERARGLRAVGQQSGGWAASASKTIGVPTERLFEAFADEALRRRWLADADLRLRTATAPKVARYDWEGGPSRVVASFTPRQEGRSTVTVQHERLRDANHVAEMKAYWRDRVAALKAMLEGG